MLPSVQHRHYARYKYNVFVLVTPILAALLLATHNTRDRLQTNYCNSNKIILLLVTHNTAGVSQPRYLPTASGNGIDCRKTIVLPYLLFGSTDMNFNASLLFFLFFLVI